MNLRSLLLGGLAILGGIVALTDPWAILLIALTLAAYPLTDQPSLHLLAALPLCILIASHAPRLGALAVLLVLALLVLREHDLRAYLAAALPAAAAALLIAPAENPVLPILLALGVSATLVTLVLLVFEYRQTARYRRSSP